MEKYFEKENYELYENGDGSFRVELSDTKSTYYIDSDGNILDDIYRIRTVEELKEFRDKVNSGEDFEGKVVYLMNDIDLNKQEEWTPIGFYDQDSTIPDDSDNKPFKGIFEGQGHEIDGIYINNNNKVQGLFGIVTSGKILNLKIGADSEIAGNIAAAGIAAYLYDGAQIVNCENNATVKGVRLVGGVTGITLKDCRIINCVNKATVKSESDTLLGIEAYTGGITGKNEENSIIVKCANFGNVIGLSAVGGIAGGNWGNSKIEECYNLGDIEATSHNEYNSSNIGGISGTNISTNSKIMNCYNTGGIKAEYNNIGGIVGLNRGYIQNLYNIGEIEQSGENIGSVVGNNSKLDSSNIGYIKNSYSLESWIGSICGYNTSTISNECSELQANVLKNTESILGNSFKTDSNNINRRISNIGMAKISN